MHGQEVHDSTRLAPKSIPAGTLLIPERLTKNLIRRKRPTPKRHRRHLRRRIRNQLRISRSGIPDTPTLRRDIPNFGRQPCSRIRNLINQRCNRRLLTINGRILGKLIRKAQTLSGIKIAIRQGRSRLTKCLGRKRQRCSARNDHAAPPGFCR